jgi:hypothetical protein
MNRRIPLLLVALGIALLLAGFFYDAIVTGIPYQDPPSALQAEYERNSRIATDIYWSGTLAIAAGLVWLIVRMVARHIAPPISPR